MHSNAADHRAQAEKFFRAPSVQGGPATGSALQIAEAQAVAQREKTERLRAQRLALQASVVASVETATRKARARRRILAA